MQCIVSRTRPSILGTPVYPAPLTIADWSGRRPVFDGAHNRRQHCPCNAATGHLADDAADIRRRGRIGEQRNQHAEDLSAYAATNRTRDGVSKRTEIDILGCVRGDISADGAADDLYDQIDEKSRHDAILPGPVFSFSFMQGAGPSPHGTT